MNPIDLLLLLILSVLWGGSFVFMRFLSPVFGPFITAGMRLLFGGVFLLFLFAVVKHKIDWRRNWKQFLIIGLVNSAVPFVMYSFAALHIPGSVSAIVNSMSPVFGAVFSAIWLAENLTVRKALGLAVGVGGVALVSIGGAVQLNTESLLAIGACIIAAMCYGLAGVYIKRKASKIDSMSIACASQLLAGAVLVPLFFTYSGSPGITWLSLLILFLFGIFCSGIAYLIYFRLIRRAGPTKALTVTFLIPIFGIAGSRLFLGEAITPSIIVGCVIILVGTFLVTAGVPGND